jgi:phosphatidylserine/phosphatidylglycerophosphate/cardiolipin synthase-like enzyme
MEVRFSPRGDCTEALIAFIGNAKKVIRVQAYSFTSEPIAEALVKAKAKGVDVAVILDKSNLTARATKLPSLLDGKVPVLIDSKHAIAHDKVIIVDSLHIETGSFNFTNAAEASNAENCLIIRDHKDLAKAYGDNWNEHKAHSAAPDKKALKRTHP